MQSERSFFIGVSPADNNETCNNWINEYGIGYPTIGKEGGGADIRTQYVIAYFPTVILIAPDRSIVIQDLYPITDSDFIVNELAAFGIEEHDCGSNTNCNPATNVRAVAEGSNVNIIWNAPNNNNAIYFEDFESSPLGSVPDNWIALDEDGDFKTWTVYGGFITHSGENVIASFSFDGSPLAPDNYLISPKVEGVANVNYFYSVNDLYPADHYAVCVSSTGTNAEDFTMIFEETPNGQSKGDFRA